MPHAPERIGTDDGDGEMSSQDKSDESAADRFDGRPVEKQSVTVKTDDADADHGPSAKPDRTRDGPEEDGTAAERRHVERVALRAVPRLARMSLISIWASTPRRTPELAQRPLGHHYLVESAGPDPRRITIVPVESPAFDRYAPIVQSATSEGYLWRLDDSLAGLFEPGSSAIAVPFDLGLEGSGVLTLVRSLAEPAFALDDLVALQDLVAEDDRSSVDALSEEGQPVSMTSFRHVLALRDLLRDLLATDTPYEVARRMARAAQTFFEARSCVVYFVSPRASSDSLGSRPIDPDEHPSLQLAASIGSGVALTPPWLAPPGTAGPSAIFAGDQHGPVLEARFGDDGAWIERQQAEGDVLIALALRHEGRLVAVLGMRRSSSLNTIPSVTVENFAYIAGLSLEVARQREAEQSTGLVLRSELARSRLAQDALLAMIGAPTVVAGLAAQAGVLVPGIADGYLVYLDPTLLSGTTQQGIQLTEGLASRVISHWRTHRDPSRLAALERWVDDRIGPALVAGRGIDRRDAPPGGDDQLPIFVSDVDPTRTTPSPARDDGGETRIRSLAAIPLIRDRVWIGALVLVTTEHGRRYGPRDFSFIESLSEPVSRALAALTPKPRQDLPRAQPTWAVPSSDSRTASLLAALGTRLLAASDIDEIGRTVAESFTSWRAEWCVVELRDDDGTVRTLGAHTDPDRLWPTPLWARMSRDRDPLRGPAHVMRTGSSDLSPTLTWASAALGPVSSSAVPPFPTSSLSVAIRHHGEIVGVITCLRSDRADPFGLADLAVAEAISVAADQAIDAVRRLEHERAENGRLRWLFEQHTQLMRQLAAAVIAVDAFGTMVYANDAARELHGGGDLSGTITDYVRRYGPVEVRGQPYTGSSFPLATALADGVPAQGMWAIQSGDRQTVVVGHAAPLRDDRGNVTGGVLSLHDLTPEYETALLRQHQLLDLANELLSPMTSIKGWVQYLGQRARAPIDRASEARALDSIAYQTRTLQRLVDQVAATARLDLDAEDFPHRLASLRETQGTNQTNGERPAPDPGPPN